MTPRTAPALTGHASVSTIINTVANHYRIPVSEICSARRRKSVCLARHVGMYLARELTPYSLPNIGRLFGGRDHTTVMSGIQRIETLREQDIELDEAIVRLTARIEAGGPATGGHRDKEGISAAQGSADLLAAIMRLPANERPVLRHEVGG